MEMAKNKKWKLLGMLASAKDEEEKWIIKCELSCNNLIDQ